MAYLKKCATCVAMNRLGVLPPKIDGKRTYIAKLILGGTGYCEYCLHITGMDKKSKEELMQIAEQNFKFNQLRRRRR